MYAYMHTCIIEYTMLLVMIMIKIRTIMQILLCDTRMHYFTLLFLVKHAANLYSLMHMRLYCKHLT